MNASVLGEGPAVVFIHGLPTSGELWQTVISRLQHDLACVTIDLPGFGQSPSVRPGPPDPKNYAHDVEVLREQLGIGHWSMVGHDAGCAVAVHYLDLYPARVDRLVLCSAPLFADFNIPWFFRLVRMPVIGDAVAPLVNKLLWKVVIPSSLLLEGRLKEQIVEAFSRPFRVRGGTRRLVEMLRWGDPLKVLARTEALLPAITAPTLVLHGTYDRIIPYEYSCRLGRIIRNVRVESVKGGHFLPLNCPDEVAVRIRRFLLGEEEPRSRRLRSHGLASPGPIRVEKNL